MCTAPPTLRSTHALWERSTHKGGTSGTHQNECWRESNIFIKASVILLRGSTLPLEDVLTSSTLCSAMMANVQAKATSLYQVDQRVN